MAEEEKNNNYQEEENRLKAQERVKALEASGRVKVDKKQAVVGDNSQYEITMQNGERGDITIDNRTSDVSARGEQGTQIKGAVETGNINGSSAADKNNSDIKQQNIDLVLASDLSPEAKSELISTINNTDFTKNGATHQEYSNSVKAKIQEKEAKTDTEKDPNAMEQAFNKVMSGGSKNKEEKSAITPTTLTAAAIAANAMTKSMSK